MNISEIRRLSLAYSYGDIGQPRKRERRERGRRHEADPRWISAYEEAVFVCGYQGHCTFELDGITVTVLEPNIA